MMQDEYEMLKANHDPNDESHKGKIGICIYCLMIDTHEHPKKLSENI